MAIHAASLDEAISGLTQPLRICRQLGIDHQETQTVILAWLPRIVEAYWRKLQSYQIRARRP